MAEALAQAGADIAIWGTNAGKNAAAAARLAAHGRRVHTAVVDVGDPAAVQAATDATVGALGRIDGCFANAGIGGSHRGGFDTLPADDWRRVLRINLDGVFHTFQSVVRHMLTREGGGTLVATSSLAAIHGAARHEHYAASKGAVIAMIRALAVEYAKRGIRAHAVLPGWVETGMTDARFADPRFAAAVKPRIPVGRWGEPADFGGVAIYLMSSASAWHTGDTLLIDGGYALY